MTELKPFWCDFCEDYHERWVCPHPGRGYSLGLEAELSEANELLEDAEFKNEDYELTIDELRKTLAECVAENDNLKRILADQMLENHEEMNYKRLYEFREEELECAHKRIRDIKKCQRYNFSSDGTYVKFRFGKWIKHEDMVKAAALPHPDDHITEAVEVEEDKNEDS